MEKYREGQNELHCVFVSIWQGAKRGALVFYEKVRSTREVC